MRGDNCQLSDWGDWSPCTVRLQVAYQSRVKTDRLHVRALIQCVTCPLVLCFMLPEEWSSHFGEQHRSDIFPLNLVYVHELEITANVLYSRCYFAE